MTTVCNMKRRFLSRLAAGLILSVAATASLAQSVDGPPSVCSSEEFDVSWEGPNGGGDLIAIAAAATPAEQSLDSASTAAGNPARLTAPAAEGVYELRYVAGGQTVLVRDSIAVAPCNLGPSGGSSGSAGNDGRASGAAAGGSAGLAGRSSKALIVSGIQTDYGDVVNRDMTSAMGSFTADDLCAASDRIGWAMSEIVNQIERSMQEAGSPVSLGDVEYLPGAPTRAGIEDSVRTARDEFCNTEEPPPSVQPFVITYAYCRMAMVTPINAMDIHLPPQAGTGKMSLADFQRREVMQMSLKRDIDAVSTVIGSGWSGQVNMTSAGSGGERIGYPTTQYAFEYAGGPGRDGIAGMFGASIKVQNTGTAWVSNDVPGIDIMRTFYENLTTEVSRGDGSFGFFDGMINNLVGMLQNGMPLEIEQTVSSSINGRTSVSGRSHQLVTNVEVVDFQPAWCESSLMPADYAVTDIDQQIDQAFAESGMTSEEMSQAMQEYQKAMEQMTPEQREMMEQFGSSNLLEQMMGGAGGAGGAAAAGSVGAAAASGGSSASAALITGNPAQSAQNLLQALGYDPGNTTGDASLATQIAISEFQADSGMAVTGEVSDELIRALSSAVDRRGGQ